MEAVKLRLCDRGQPDLPLQVGIHGIGRLADGGIGLVPASQAPSVNMCVDRRGVWLTVPEGARGVHVNGREVRRMAMLRVGDAIYVDGNELRLVASAPPLAPDASLHDGDGHGDPRVVLRGVGGQYHGRSITLERPRLVGRSREADIRIDDPAFAERHARLELVGEDVVLRDLGSAEGSLVNGDPVRDALLKPGDQIVFDAHHRFVVESPTRPRRRAPAESAADAPVASAGPVVPATGMRRLPWLLLAALLIAAALSALLLFGRA